MTRVLPATGPQRVLAASNLVYTLGSGLYLTAGVLYFTEAVHLPLGEVGLGLGIAGVLALVLGIVVGRLADRRDARAVYLATLVVQAAATASFLVADQFWLFVGAVCAAAGAKSAGVAARSPLIRRHGGDRPQQFRAYLRSVTNVGVSVGALLAGWAVQTGTVTAYRVMVIANVIAFAAAAGVLLRLPKARPEPSDPSRPAGTGPGWAALRDRPYLLLTALDGVMALQFKVLTVALPLWIVTDTVAPRWLVAGTMVTGTVLVVLFQVRASRGIDSPTAGGLAYRRAGVAFLISCTLVAFTSDVSSTTATVLLLVAVVIHTVGELWHAGAGFEVSFALAPVSATGEYLGVFGLGAGLAEAFGPGLLIALCITGGRAGWFVVGGLLAVTGALTPWAVRRARAAESDRAPGPRAAAEATRPPRPHAAPATARARPAAAAGR
jgi:MFS family permease